MAVSASSRLDSIFFAACSGPGGPFSCVLALAAARQSRSSGCNHGFGGCWGSLHHDVFGGTLMVARDHARSECRGCSTPCLCAGLRRPSATVRGQRPHLGKAEHLVSRAEFEDREVHIHDAHLGGLYSKIASLPRGTHPEGVPMMLRLSQPCRARLPWPSRP